MKKYFVVLLSLFLLVGCSSDKNNDNGLISYMDAKEKIINNGAILVDVRTEEEFNQRHIDGAVMLTLDTISDETASEVIDNKDTPVIVYCRSGNRSSQAVTLLNDLGYTDVYDLGSMDNWEE